MQSSVHWLDEHLASNYNRVLELRVSDQRELRGRHLPSVDWTSCVLGRSVSWKDEANAAVSMAHVLGVSRGSNLADGVGAVAADSDCHERTHVLHQVCPSGLNLECDDFWNSCAHEAENRARLSGALRYFDCSSPGSAG